MKKYKSKHKKDINIAAGGYSLYIKKTEVGDCAKIEKFFCTVRERCEKMKKKIKVSHYSFLE